MWHRRDETAARIRDGELSTGDHFTTGRTRNRAFASGRALPAIPTVGRHEAKTFVHRNRRSTRTGDAGEDVVVALRFEERYRAITLPGKPLRALVSGRAGDACLVHSGPPTIGKPSGTPSTTPVSRSLRAPRNARDLGPGSPAATCRGQRGTADTDGWHRRSPGTTRPASDSPRRHASKSSASTSSPGPARHVSRLMTDTATDSACFRRCFSAIGMPAPTCCSTSSTSCPSTAARNRAASAAEIAARSSDISSAGTWSCAGHACSSIGCGRLGRPTGGLCPSSAHRRPYWSGMVPQPQYGTGTSERIPTTSMGSTLAPPITAVGPVIAQVEGELELRPEPQQPSDFGRLDVHRLGDRSAERLHHLGAGLGVGDYASVGEGEHRQVRAVPPGEGVVHRVREVAEGVRRSDREDAAGPWPQLLSASAEQFHGHRQPRSCHCSRMACRRWRRLVTATDLTSSSLVRGTFQGPHQHGADRHEMWKPTSHRHGIWKLTRKRV